MSMTEQDRVVSRFAALLGTKSLQREDAVALSLVHGSDHRAAASRELLLCLSKSLEDHEVVCTLPSLDMRHVDDESSGMTLPKVGEHRHKEVVDIMMTGSEGKVVPQMAASVLGNAAEASATAAKVEQKAARRLGSLTSWTKSSVVYASEAISKNISDSFSSLVDSRVRAWTLLLLRHSLTTGDPSSRSRLLSMLSSIIEVKSATTAFNTIPLPETAAAQSKEADVILPLLLEVVMEVSIENKVDTVALRAPGTIAGDFDKSNEVGKSLGLVKVDIRLDTGAMLESMVQQARMIVFKAVAKATSAAESLVIHLKTAGTNSEELELEMEAPTSLSGFSSALNISSGINESPGPHQPGHRLHKAKTSALKLNSVLQGELGKVGADAALDKTRKSRSVQWDHATSLLRVQTPRHPSPKRQRVADTTARLRSFKSFGRPHAGDFGSGPRNATFGDFGSKPIWGRDGKLANRPTPVNPNNPNNDPMSGESKSAKNATFNFQRPSIHLSSGLDLDITHAKKSGLASHVSTRGLPRTATASEQMLEGWLRKNAGGRHGL